MARTLPIGNWNSSSGGCLSTAPVVSRKKRKTHSISKPQSGGRAEHAASATELPKGALELFTRRVQPLLVNNCTASGCHRPEGPTEFSLSRAILYGESNQKTTHHNLSAALAQIDRTNPTQSPLLVVPLKPHGGLDHAIFPPHRRTLRQLLVQWVTLVTDEVQLPYLAELDQPTIFLPPRLVPSQTDGTTRGDAGHSLATAASAGGSATSPLWGYPAGATAA